MKTTLLIWLGLNFVAWGNDTPFIKYRCSCDAGFATSELRLEFKNEPGYERVDWSVSFIKKLHVTFEKTDPAFVSVRVTTGAPLISYAVPEEYRFSAPLLTESFDFSVSLRGPVPNDRALLSLKCLKDWETES